MELDNLISKLETFWLCCESENDFNNEVPADVIYIYKTAKKLAIKEQDLDECFSHCEATLEAVWEQLNTGHWSSVPLAPRRLYAQGSLLKGLLLLRRARTPLPGGVEQRVVAVQAALSACDLGLLLGAPLSALQDAAQVLNAAQASFAVSPDKEAQPSSELLPPIECLSDEGLPSALPIPVLKCPSMESFYTQHFCARKPALLTDCIEHWPARSKWSAAYLRKVAGGRTVPVELGAHYADDNWSQQLMTLRQFVDVHLLQPGEQQEALGATKQAPLGYLAQHPLFDQVPELRNDIYEPEYCCLREPRNKPEKEGGEEEEEEESDELGPEINAWFGPAGTLSPLHFDPKHNILAQVKGFKRVWLFSPDDSAYLYPHENATLLSNTARVDPEKPDLAVFPAYSNATALRCVLRPGEALYIPPRWWHHVRSLTPSMSVSFWWE